MALTDAHWKKMLRAFKLKMIEQADRLTYSDVPSLDVMFQLMKENWDLLTDEEQLDTYIKDEKRAELVAKRNRAQVALDGLDNEINKLK